MSDEIKVNANGANDVADGSEELTFPRSYKEYRIHDPFTVYAHSEEQALKRWQFFKDVLGRLFGNEHHAHDLVLFVQPESAHADVPQPSIEFVEEVEVDSMPFGSMASGDLAEGYWLMPDFDADWSAAKLAYRIFNGQLDEEDEQLLAESGDRFWF